MVQRSPQLLTTGDVARLTGFSSSAILQWIRAGKLPAFSSPGGQYRVAPEALCLFLKEHGMRVPEELAAADRIRILVVEDEEIVRCVLVRMLRECGARFIVEAAGNGVTGCMKIPVFKPHLIILDLIMPEMDGVEVCRSLKSTPEWEAMKILLVTGYADDERFQPAMAAGADDYILKPIRLRDLHERVTRLLRLPPATACAPELAVLA